MTAKRREAVLYALSATVFLLAASVPAHAAAPWRELAPGLELAAFPMDGQGASSARLHVLRVDPKRWELTLHWVGDGDGPGWSTRDWASREGLVAAANAGMYQEDYRTHAGFMAADGKILSRGVNGYLSAAAFEPNDPADAPFRVFDLDETALDEVRRRYRRVVQNLRLVKRPGENRWRPQERRWSEVALGEDGAGRALLLFSRTPLPLDRFTAALLALPLDLVAAQHLEGGSDAQLFLQAGGERLELVGSAGFGFFEPSERVEGAPIPNVIGVRRRR